MCVVLVLWCGVGRDGVTRAGLGGSIRQYVTQLACFLLTIRPVPSLPSTKHDSLYPTGDKLSNPGFIGVYLTCLSLKDPSIRGVVRASTCFLLPT